jgi:hypothetical protein
MGESLVDRQEIHQNTSMNPNTKAFSKIPIGVDIQAGYN